MTDSVYHSAGGLAGLTELARAWHERCLADPVVSHAFHGGVRHDHVERLAAYWAEALGGPPGYTSLYDTETQVWRTHSGNGPHEEMDRRAQDCFLAALDDVGIVADPLHATLADWFEWSIRRMATYHVSPDDVPADAVLPRWTWDGPALA